MKKIDFSQFDLQGITLQDFEFIQKAYTEIAEGITSPFGDYYILSGCNVSLSGSAPITASITAGWMVFDKEVVKVDAHTASLSTIGDFKFKITSTPTSPTPSLFGDNSLRDVHFERRVVIDATGTISGFAVPKISNVLFDIVVPANAPVVLDLSAEWEPGVTPTINPSYRVDGRTCHLIGDVRYKLSSPTTPTIPYLALLPGSARPIANTLVSTIACHWDAINNEPINIESIWVLVQANGVVTAPHTTGKSIILNFSYPIN